MKNLILGFLFLFVWISVASGAVYYVNPDTANTGYTGAYDNEFKTLAQINAWSATANDGDDLYFKVGTTLSLAAGERFNVYWEGTDTDQAIIGAYYGDALFGLNGEERPIISGLVGSTRTGGSLSSGAIRYRPNPGTGYLTVKDLHVTGVIGYGVEISGAYGTAGEGHSVEYCTVENVKTSNTGSVGVILFRTYYSSVLDCIIDDANNDLINYSSGDGLDINGGLQEWSMYNVVRGNTVSNCYEGIGNYKGARYTTIENNTVYDCQTYLIYTSNSRDTTIRNNLIYSSYGKGTGIFVDNESHTQTTCNYISGHRIHGNRIAGTSRGIGLGNEGGTSTGNYPTDFDIYNNRIVDTERNFNFARTDPNWSDIIINDNYSFIYTSPFVHSYMMSPPGVTWSGNHYNTTIVSVTGNAATTAVYNDPVLIKTTGWRSLTAGAVTTDDFKFVDEDIDTCTSMGYHCCDTGTGAQPAYDPDCTVPGEECYTECTVAEGTTLDTTDLYGGSGSTFPVLRAYLFDDGILNPSSAVLTDYSPEGDDATLTNPNWVTTGLSMDTVGQLIASDVPAIGDDWTIMFRFTSLGDEPYTNYGKFSYLASAIRDWQIEEQTTPSIRIDINSIGHTIPISVDIFDKSAHTLIVTGDDSGDSVCLYIDGALVSCDTTSYTNPTFSGLWYLGSKDVGDRIAGLVFHQVMVWNDKFSAGDVTAVQANPTRMFNNPPDRGLISGSPVGHVNRTDTNLPIARRVYNLN